MNEGVSLCLRTLRVPIHETAALCISDSLSDYGGKARPSVAGAAMSEHAVPVVHKTKKTIPGD